MGACALIVLDEGDEALVAATMGIVEDECRSASVLDSALVARWLDHRNNVGQLAPLWEAGIVVDTIEVAGPWSILATMHQRVTSELSSMSGVLAASVHQSHAYIDGACLYFTFAGKPGGDHTDFYRRAWDVATKAVLESGGALSHHHGVGRNRARFVKSALGSGFPLLESLKRQLDPLDILNPGALGIGGAPW